MKQGDSGRTNEAGRLGPFPRCRAVRSTAPPAPSSVALLLSQIHLLPDHSRAAGESGGGLPLLRCLRGCPWAVLGRGGCGRFLSQRSHWQQPAV